MRRRVRRAGIGRSLRMFSLLRRKPLFSICIPAYRAHEFIEDTINSALRQSVDDVEIIISNDASLHPSDLSRWQGHAGIRLFQHRKRLGWVENSNFALSRARGRYFMVLPHDDVLEPTYLEECHRVLESDAEVFAAYSDIETDARLMQASEARGLLSARIAHVMSNLYNGYSYRALMQRKPRNWKYLKLQSNLPTNFCVDSTWILQQACLGELRRIPKPLYWKRMFERNTHQKWRELPGEKLLWAWKQHCVQMRLIASKFVNDAGLIDELFVHRCDARRVKEAPKYLKDLFSHTN